MTEVEVVIGTPFASSITEGTGVSQGGYSCVGAAIPIVDDAQGAHGRRFIFCFAVRVEKYR